MLSRRAFAWLLLSALLLSQSLGLLHRTVHGAGLRSIGVASLQAVLPGDSGVRASLDALFGGHDGASDCRLFDQLAQGDVLSCLPVVPMHAAPMALLIVQLQGLAVARWAALFEARGPPSLR